MRFFCSIFWRTLTPCNTFIVQYYKYNILLYIRLIAKLKRVVNTYSVPILILFPQTIIINEQVTESCKF